MRKHLAKLIKQEGHVDIVIATIISVLILSFFFVYFVSNMIPVNRNIGVEGICRKYMFTIEQNGYLTADNKTALINDFSKIGISSIDISGTTLSQVDYGDPVYLSVTYQDKIRQFVINNGIIPGFTDITKTISIKKNSTSVKVKSS